ncbi:hypothetical protein IAU59_001982 [Kwoniella sp. CBS 9459]
MPPEPELHPLDRSVSVSSPSFHPTLTLNLAPSRPSSSSPTKEEECSPVLYLSLDIPEGIFVDPDEVGDKLLSYGVRDWSLSSSSSSSPGARSKGSGDPEPFDHQRDGTGRGSESVIKGKSGGKWKAKAKVDIERPSFDLSGYRNSHGEEEVFQLRMTVMPTHQPGVQSGAGSSSSRAHDLISEWEWTIEIPLHGRYIPPNESGTGAIRIPADDGLIEGESEGLRGGWACIEDFGVSISEANPFNEDRASSSTADSGSLLPEAPIKLSKVRMMSEPVEIHLPTGKMSHQPLVEGVTTLVIWLGWAWLVYKILRLRSRTSSLDQRQKGGGRGKDGKIDRGNTKKEE